MQELSRNKRPQSLPKIVCTQKSQMSLHFMSFVKSELKIFTSFGLCCNILLRITQVGSECLKMEGKALVWETIRENAMGDLGGRKTQNNQVISNESHNKIARSETSVSVTKLFVRLFTFLPPELDKSIRAKYTTYLVFKRTHGPFILTKSLANKMRHKQVF